MLEYFNMLHKMEQLNTLKESPKDIIDKAFPQEQKLLAKHNKNVKF